MKLRALPAVLALVGVTACGSSAPDERVDDLHDFAVSAYAWSQEVNKYLADHATKYKELRAAVIALHCEGIPPSECPIPPADEEDPPSGKPSAYPPN